MGWIKSRIHRKSSSWGTGTTVGSTQYASDRSAQDSPSGGGGGSESMRAMSKFVSQLKISTTPPPSRKRLVHKRQTSRSDEFVYDSPNYDHSVDEVVVEGCGVPEVNGKYKRGGISNMVPMYSRVASYGGREEQFSLFQYKVSDITCRWYISIVPKKNSQNQMRSKNIDLYVADPASSFDLTFPPRTGWKCNQDTCGKGPSPKIFYKLPSFEEACILADEALCEADEKKDTKKSQRERVDTYRTPASPKPSESEANIPTSENEMKEEPADLPGVSNHQLSGVYQDPERVLKDTRFLLSSSLGIHLRTVTESLMLNDGSSSPPLLLLRGTLPITYQGAIYNLPIGIHLPPDYPLEAPSVFIRPVCLAIKGNHRYIGMDGRVRLPYLQEWRWETHELHELAFSMSSVFGREPPWVVSASDNRSPSTKHKDNNTIDGEGEGEDESMDQLARLVNQAMFKNGKDLSFTPPEKGATLLRNSELRLSEPENPSDLTLFSGGLKQYDNRVGELEEQ